MPPSCQALHLPAPALPFLPRDLCQTTPTTMVRKTMHRQLSNPSVRMSYINRSRTRLGTQKVVEQELHLTTREHPQPNKVCSSRARALNTSSNLKTNNCQNRPQLPIISKVRSLKLKIVKDLVPFKKKALRAIATTTLHSNKSSNQWSSSNRLKS